MISRFFKLVLLAGILAKPIAEAAPEQVFPLKVEQKDFANGLRVMVVPTGFPNLVSLQIPVQTGSRNEVEPGKTGFAHFFEHMMFRGTKKNPSDLYQSYLKKMGARQNAYTSNDYTNYHTTFAKEDLELMLSLEADRFMNLDYSESGFKTESRAVLGEYNKNSAQPGNKLSEVTRDAAFQVHPYKHTTMGFLKDIENMPNQFAYSKTFFDRWYRPENTTIIVAGDVDAKKVFALVEKYFSPWKRGNYKSNIPSEPAQAKPVYVHVPWESPTLARLSVGFHGPAFSTQNKDFAALSLLYELAFGHTSELYKQLVIDEQKLDSLSGNPGDSKDPDLYSVDARLKDPRDIIMVRDAILKTLMHFTKVPVDLEVLNTIRSNQKNQIRSSLDNTESIASMLATYVHYDRSAATINDLFNLMDTVTPQDIEKAAGKIFTDNNLVVSTLSQGELPADISKLPKVSSYLLAEPVLRPNVNIIVQKNKSPFLDIKLMFKAGSSVDPEGREGLALLSASMVTGGGSKKKTFDEIQKALFPLAASFSNRTDKEVTTFTLRVPKNEAGKVFALVLPTLLEPGLKNEDFTRIKTDLLNGLKNDLRTNNEEELGKERLQELIFNGTPFAHPVDGTVAGLEAITLSDVQKFIAEAYTQGALTIGVNGDISDTTLAQLKHDLASLPNKDGLKIPTLSSVKTPDGINVNIIEKNTRATALSFGHAIDVNRAHPDFAALWLARAWLGEHRSSMSHLFDRIREIRGMNYGDYAYIEAFPHAGYQFFPAVNVDRHNQIFEVWIRPVAPENAQMALRIAIYELNKLIENGLTDKEFQETRDYLMKNVFLMTSTQNQQLGYALDSAWWGMGEYTKTMRERLQKLNVNDVNAALKKHLSAKNIQVVAVTKDAKGLEDLLKKDAFSPIKYDGEKPKELLDEDRVIGALKLNISKVSISPVDTVFSGKK
ncbi:MAG: insulinase family protein [Chitinophagaceae bacterium]|nr:insulinase family protein [Oligoflexus sp.]